ncbi:hypothetical protein KY290_031080 [Solanum tuberosum]|uniref:Uncharacterized protein n=1 Tax=Solanum tuberosum TaxID=4113 RepID=A0ABQ7U9Y5_SOLTU|nr:hypothetical protein KY290_031080 [Solanum tuberosum]
MAHIRTQIDLLTKHIVAKSEKGYNSGNAGQNYARDGQYVGHQIEIKETGKTQMGIGMIAVVVMCPQAIETG